MQAVDVVVAIQTDNSLEVNFVSLSIPQSLSKVKRNA